MNKKFIYIVLVLLLSGCHDTGNKNEETPQRKNITINDILNRDKIKDPNKLKLISDINPDEQYAIGIETSLTPIKDRKSLSEMTVGEVIKKYEQDTGETVINGRMEYANDLKFKELQITSALILYTQTIPKEDQLLVKEYMARRLFKPDEMNIARNEKISELVKKARLELKNKEKRD